MFCQNAINSSKTCYPNNFFNNFTKIEHVLQECLSKSGSEDDSLSIDNNFYIHCKISQETDLQQNKLAYIEIL